MGKTYVGVGSKAQEVKKIYVGVNGIARQVKRAYVGVNGVARLIYSADPDILILYNQGDQCKDITGGWAGSSSSIFKTNYISLSYTSSSSQSVGTVNSIDFTKFSKLYIDGNGLNSYVPRIYNVNTKKYINTVIDNNKSSDIHSSHVIYYVDNVSTWGNTRFYIYPATTNMIPTNIYKVWLE